MLINIKILNVKALGTRIQSYRERLKLSREDLALISGLKAGNIAKLENGRGTKLDLETIAKISNALKITLDDLLVDSLDRYNVPNELDNIMSVVNSFSEDQMKTYIEMLHDYKSR